MNGEDLLILGVIGFVAYEMFVASPANGTGGGTVPGANPAVDPPFIAANGSRLYTATGQPVFKAPNGTPYYLNASGQPTAYTGTMPPSGTTGSQITALYSAMQTQISTNYPGTANPMLSADTWNTMLSSAGLSQSIAVTPPTPSTLFGIVPAQMSFATYWGAVEPYLRGQGMSGLGRAHRWEWAA